MNCFILQTRHQGHRDGSEATSALSSLTDGPGNKERRTQCEKSNKEAATGESQGTKGSRGHLSARGGKSGKRMFQLDF